jgi:hypothetical protein
MNSYYYIKIAPMGLAITDGQKSLLSQNAARIVEQRIFE